MKKIILLILVLSGLTVTRALADESWKDMYVTRLMKLMTSNPTYTNIILTDLDRDSVPEVFMAKYGMNGGIKAGFTLKNNVITNINVPENITGAALSDLTVYNVDGNYSFVGKEISRYTANIDYYELSISDNTLTAIKVLKNDYSKYPSIPYEDIAENDLFNNDFPDRKKLEAFISKYTAPTQILLKPATAKLSVDGNTVDVSGINVNENNYYKLRDIAMILFSSPSKFNISWDDSLGAIRIETGKKYTPIGGELSEIENLTTSLVEKKDITLIVNDTPQTLTSYNINGSNYFKIRDVSTIAGFEVGWDQSNNIVTISN